MPHILDLPTELLIEIFKDLDLSDFGSCLLTCRRLKVIIQSSFLLQYLIHTTLAGVDGPSLESGYPLTDCLESLQRWSDAWHQPGAYLRSPSRVLTRTAKNSTDFVLCDDYLIARDFGGRHGYRHVAGYEWLDLRDPSDCWTKIQFEGNLVPFAFALDTDQGLMAVFFGCPEYATFQLRLLEFHDGSPHPLASRPSVDISLPTNETHYIGLETHMSIMGPYLVVAAGLPPESTGKDILLLVDWQKGHVTTLCSTQSRVYLTDFLVLSDDVLALIRGPENAIELCRIDTTIPTASLQTIRILQLPSLLPYARLSSVSLKTEGNPRASTLLQVPGRLSRRPPPRHPFSPSPNGALVLLNLTAKLIGSAFVDMRTYTLAIHARTLLSYASPSSSSHKSRSSLPLVVPWVFWGIPTTRCFEEHTGSSSESSAVVVAGQRWFDAKSGAIRDFCPYRMRRAPALAADISNSHVELRSTTLAAGRVFACDIESALPYSEITLEKDDLDSSFVVEDVMIDMERVVFLSETNRDQITIHVHTMG